MAGNGAGEGAATGVTAVWTGETGHRGGACGAAMTSGGRRPGTASSSRSGRGAATAAAASAVGPPAGTGHGGPRSAVVEGACQQRAHQLLVLVLHQRHQLRLESRLAGKIAV